MYLCDIKVNFNNEFYDFFDWNKNDKIVLLKKVPLYYVSNLENVIYNKVKFPQEFLNEIKFQTISKNKKYEYACILANNTKFIAVTLNKDGIINKISDISISDDIDLNNELINEKLKSINYEVIKNNKKIKFVTRNEDKIRVFLEEKLSKSNDYEQLKYLYLENFNKKENNINIILKDLKNLLINSWDDNYLKFYEFFKVSL